MSKTKIMPKTKNSVQSKNDAAAPPANQYDLMIIGAGPAGLSAAIYAGRFKLKTLVIAEEIGGTANKAPWVENYAGVKKIVGAELMQTFMEQAQELGATIQLDSVQRIHGKYPNFRVTDNNGTFNAKALLLTLGTQHKKLGLPEEEKFLGRGVSYCATCDAALYKGKTVAVVGGSDSACMGSLILKEYAKKIYVIYRGAEIRAEPSTIEKIKACKEMEIICNATVKNIKGKDFVESIILDTGKGLKELKVDGLFVEIGSTPASVLAKDVGVKTDKEGYIIVGPDQMTSIKGIYAAGDITTNSNKFRQIITAAAEGAVAARAIFDELKK